MLPRSLLSEMVALELALEEGTEVASRDTCYGESEHSNEEIGKGRPRPMAPSYCRAQGDPEPSLCLPVLGSCTRAEGAVSATVQFTVA